MITVEKKGNCFVSNTVKLIGNGKVIVHENAQIRDNVVIEMDRGTLEIGKNSVIGYNCVIQCSGVMHIGVGSLIGPLTMLLASSHVIDNETPLISCPLIRGKLVIGNNVWVGANCTVNYNITLNDSSIIGANSFVNKDVKRNEIVGGIPAKRIRFR